jgi:hypothetical protein
VRAVAPSHTSTGEEQSDLPVLTGVQLVSGTNVRPDAPANVVEDTVVDDGGMVTIRWDAPVDPDGSVAFYRIYRDDQSAWTVRYGNTDSGASVLFTDGDGAPGAHRYWITAVDNELAESEFAPAGGFVP